MIRKLKYCPYGQAHVETDGTLTLYSYTTAVIRVTPAGWLSCTGLYSATTRRHIGYFLREYYPFLSYHDVKRIYENNQEFNVLTGEIREKGVS